MQRRFLGEILIREGLVSRDDLEKALEVQKAKLGEVLVEMGAVSADDVDRALHIQCSGPTRAEAYAVRLRAALAALALVSLVASAALWTLGRDADLRGELGAGRLRASRVRALLSDPGSSPGIRMDALRSLRGVEDRGERLSLVRLGLTDPAWGVRLVSLGLVRSLELEAVVPDLIPVLLDEEATVREGASRALEELTGERLGAEFGPWYRWAKGRGLEVKQPAHLKAVNP